MRQATSRTVRCAAAAAVYFIAAYGALLLVRGGASVAPFWPANVLGLVMVLRWAQDRRDRAVLLAVLFCASAMAQRAAGQSIGEALAFSSINVGEMLLSTVLVSCFGTTAFRSVAQGWRFFALAGPPSAIIGAAFVLVLGTVLGFPRPVTSALTWGSAELLGFVMLGPIAMTISHRELQKLELGRRWPEALGLAVMVMAVSIGAFSQHSLPLLFTISPFVLIVTFRFRLIGANAAALLAAAVAVPLTFAGLGPLALIHVGGAEVKLLVLQCYLAVNSLTSVPIAAALSQRDHLANVARRREVELEQAKAKAEAAAAAKADFLANMSHELRTPLTAIIGFTRLAAERPDLPASAHEYLSQVKAASEALVCTVTDILDFSKLEAGEVRIRLQPTDVMALCRATLKLFAPQAADKGLTLHCEGDVAADLQVDPDRVRQVLINLVGNAVKFTAVGGITLQADWDAACSRLTLSVRDTGAGIAADKLDQLFQRFAQVDGSSARTHGGTGLGLAICRGLAEAMGGEVGVESTEGRGSRFWMAVPATSCARPATRAGAPVSTSRLEGIRVLVADDQFVNRELARLFLTAAGAQVTQAEDGPATIELAGQGRYDAILLDLNMPQLDGFEVLRRLRLGGGPNQATPVVAYSASVTSQNERDIRHQGFDGVAAKPVAAEELVRIITEAIEAPGPALQQACA